VYRLSVCACIHACRHECRHLHKHSDYTKQLIHKMRSKQTWDAWSQQHGMENMAKLWFWENKCFEVWLECAQRGFLSERKGKVIFHAEGPMTEKMREPTAESLVWGIWWTLFFDTFCKVLLHLVLTQLKRTACHVQPFCLFLLLFFCTWPLILVFTLCIY